MALGPMLTALLKSMGLESLSSWASDMIIKGASEAEIELELYNQPAFKQRFPAIEARRLAGLPPISVTDYLNFEATVKSLASTWGMSIDQNEINQLLINDVSAQEVDQRFNIVAAAVYESDAETRSELSRLFGVDQGKLMKYWMDPKAELGNLQATYRMGEIAGAAVRSGYGQITAAHAARLQQAGLDREGAIAGFGELANMRQLFEPLNATETAITPDTQIELLAGDANAARLVEERAAKRKAEFEGGGGYATSEEGFATGAAR